MYLDLLGGRGHRSLSRATGAASHSEEASELEHSEESEENDDDHLSEESEGSNQYVRNTKGTDNNEKSVEQLLKEQEDAEKRKEEDGVESAEWTRRAMETQHQRRKDFKKKMQNQYVFCTFLSMLHH